MRSFPPWAERQSGRTTKAVCAAIRKVRNGKQVALVAANASHAHILFRKALDIIDEDEDFPHEFASLGNRRVTHSSGGRLDFYSINNNNIQHLHHSVEVIYDHYAVELETARIDAKITQLTNQKESILRAGFLGLD